MRAAGLGVPHSRWGIDPDGVAVGRRCRARWIVGADGGHSAVRRWAGLDACRYDSRRFGFPPPLRVAPWSDYMEIHWGDDCQLYVTPVRADEVCVVLISRDLRLRLDDALPQFPEVERRLRCAAGRTGARRRHRLAPAEVGIPRQRGAGGRRLGLGGRDHRAKASACCSSRPRALADALAAGDLALYQAEHRRIGRRPAFMADLMLLLDGRRAAVAALRAWRPWPPIRLSSHACWPLHVGRIRLEPRL